MCGPPPWSFPLPSAGSPADCTAARTAKGFPVGGKVSSGCGRFGRGSLNNRNSDELYTELRSRSISDSLEPRKHRYLRLGEQVARVPLALYVHLSSRNLGSSGVSVGCCLGEDAKLAAAPLAQGPFSRPGGRRPPRGRRRHAMAVGALVPPDATRVATVYTNGPKRLRGAIFADLCTLLRPHACPQRRNSVHKWPKTAPRGCFRRSVYTPESSRPLARPGGATGPTTSTTPWPP